MEMIGVLVMTARSSKSGGGGVSRPGCFLWEPPRGGGRAAETGFLAGGFDLGARLRAPVWPAASLHNTPVERNRFAVEKTN